MNTAERRAIAALWSIQGVGPVTLEEVRSRVGPPGELLDQPVSSWAPLVPWRADSHAHVMSVGTLAAAADRLEARCKAHGARILFGGDPAFPWRLVGIPKAPAVLFALGPAADAPPRRRIAIVGTRNIDTGSRERIAAVAAEAARAGLCVVSGAARGIDEAAHRGALAVKGETWAFLGSALDEMDLAEPLARTILARGGTVFSEFPPGFRPNKNSFTLRNRLISGASDAVLVFRAPVGSGALHTARAALAQGRPVLATPGDPWSRVAMGSNALLQRGEARPHLDLSDLLRAVGLDGAVSHPEPLFEVDLSQLSPLASEVLALLGLGPADFEGLQEELPAVGSGELSSALVELEVFGAVVHKGGRRYEKR
ncbi:MAG: DNA-processing protein DprA [Archangium sp.]|nr:DNA-processing protein DprA [Archangium sp.]